MNVYEIYGGILIFESSVVVLEISILALSDTVLICRHRDNQTTNGECVGNGYSLSGQHLAEKVKIGNAALFDSDKGD